MDDLERCLLVKSEVFVYKIPPRQSSRGYRAADWNLSAPDWTGRLRVMEQHREVRLKLEDRGSNELFAACPIQAYPGPAIEAVTDSSRYFVIRIVNESTKQNAFIGMGFADRSDSFDLNVALQDHFKGVRKEVEIAKEPVSSVPKLDLAFKAGQTIKVNINMNKDNDNNKASKPKARSALPGGSLLPPPPSSSNLILPPPTTTKLGSGSSVPPLIPAAPPSNPTTPSSSNVDLLGGFSDFSIGDSAPKMSQQAGALTTSPEDPWGDFASADNSAKESGKWVQF